MSPSPRPMVFIDPAGPNPFAAPWCWLKGHVGRHVRRREWSGHELVEDVWWIECRRCGKDLTRRHGG